jgi:hypothetical protein
MKLFTITRVTMSRLSLLALCVSCHLPVHAADVLPRHLTGTWGTAESLYAGVTGQTELLLLPDGLGAMRGSTPPASRADSIDDGKVAPRAIVGPHPHLHRTGRRPDGDEACQRYRRA